MIRQDKAERGEMEIRAGWSWMLVSAGACGGYDIHAEVYADSTVGQIVQDGKPVQTLSLDWQFDSRQRADEAPPTFVVFDGNGPHTFEVGLCGQDSMSASGRLTHGDCILEIGMNPDRALIVCFEASTCDGVTGIAYASESSR